MALHWVMIVKCLRLVVTTADMQSDEYDSDETSNKPRLNMKHGFIYHIRRNQIARDNYDKKVKSTVCPKHQLTNPSKKPENKLYKPPGRNEKDGSDLKLNVSSSSEVGNSLFILEYTTNDGRKHSVLVKQGQDPGRLAKRLQHDAAIPKDLIETLEWKIKQEQIKRS
ncbi:UPF0561 protein C2orf68-like [Clavelina lepadiformis]